MRTFGGSLALLTVAIRLISTAHAQDDSVMLVRRAAQCLAAKGFLAHAEARELAFGYIFDAKSYPGETLLYVVNYEYPSRPNGFVFTIVVTEQSKRYDFNIQNNARFILASDGSGGVSFVDQPLGGTWTRKHLVSAIKQIERQPRSTISIRDMRAVDSSFSCEAYTDPQQKTNPNPSLSH